MTPCDVMGDIARRKTSHRADNIQHILHVSFGRRSRVDRKTKREGAFGNETRRRLLFVPARHFTRDGLAMRMARLQEREKARERLEILEGRRPDRPTTSTTSYLTRPADHIRPVMTSDLPWSSTVLAAGARSGCHVRMPAAACSPSMFIV